LIDTLKLYIDIAYYTEKLSIQPSLPVQVDPGYSNIEFYVVNSGLGFAYSGSLEISTTAQQLYLFERSIKVGDMPPNSSLKLDIPAYISPTLIGSLIPLNLKLNYIDECGFSRQLNALLYINVRQPTEPNIILTADPATLLAGDENKVIIRVLNDGDIALKSIDLQFNFPQGLILRNDATRISIGELGPGSSINLPLVLVPTGTINNGTVVQASVILSYKDEYDLVRTSNKFLTFIVIRPRVIIATDLSPKIVNPGENVIAIQVKNYGDIPLFDVLSTVSFQQAVPIGFDGKWYIGSLSPGEIKSIEVPIMVPSTASNIQASLTLSYVDPTGSTKSETRLMNILVSGEKALTVNIYPQVVMSGQPNTLKVLVRNPNNFTAWSAILTIMPQSDALLLNAQDTYYLDSIKPGEEISLEIPVYVLRTAGTTISVPVTLKYSPDKLVTVTLTRNVVLLVSHQPLLKVTNYATQPQTIAPGQIFSTSLTIANTGLGTAFNVTVLALPSALYTPLLGNEAFLGDIGKGTSTTVSFSFRLSSEINSTLLPATGNLTRAPHINVTELPQATAGNSSIETKPLSLSAKPSVNVLILYSDNVGRQYNVTLSIPLAIGNYNTTTSNISGRAGFNTSLLIVVISLLAVPIAAYTLFKRRRKLESA
ncbi:MAG: hypothetical protein QXV04_05755, partial [Desulfurococcaceae archaeon]